MLDMISKKSSSITKSISCEQAQCDQWGKLVTIEYEKLTQLDQQQSGAKIAETTNQWQPF